MSTKSGAEHVETLADLDTVAPATQIAVPISYDIIRLFSEGLYQSPQKAIEELVSNSYDANATVVRVLMPPTGPSQTDRLWVIDNGDGLDALGFEDLWKIAESRKATQNSDGVDRPPIGQFGIGKLASYVLAWRLTHISRLGESVRVTSMNFKGIEGIRQNDSETGPFQLGLHELTLDQAKSLMADIETRDPDAWELLFGPSGSSHWTAAGLSEFKDLYSKLGVGRLKWVLRTAMPLVSEFKIFVDGDELSSSKENAETLLSFPVGGASDQIAEGMGLEHAADTDGPFIEIPGIVGKVRGTVALFKKRLTENKSDRWNRSNGFFIRVRGRIINIDDELFGAPALNHATWSRFAMELDADGLRDHLLSSREGVRESDPIETLRAYLLSSFNRCRVAYDGWVDEQDAQADIGLLLQDAPSTFVVEPLVEAVSRAVRNDTESYYVGRVPDLDGTDRDAWLKDFSAQVSSEPVADVLWTNTGVNDRAIRYRADSRILMVNEDHPYVAKLLASERKTRVAASLFASSELLVDALLQDYGLRPSLIFDLLADRDRVLRLVAGVEPTSAAEVLRLLRSAMSHETALERAVGLVFRSLGFEYERRGGNKGGADGVLDGRLGRGAESLEDYRLVYDTKQTKDPAVPADKIKPSSLWTFREDEKADYGFFLAIKYDAEHSLTSKLNKEVHASVSAGMPITLLKVEHLQRLVEMHYRYGVTLTRLRSLFEVAHTVPEVDAWLNDLENELTTLEPRVPLAKLLGVIEAAKSDELATPTVSAVRVLDDDLRQFTPGKLGASLRAVAEIVGTRFLELDDSSGEVRLHTTASQIVAEVDRSLQDLLGGVNAPEWPDER